MEVCVDRGCAIELAEVAVREWHGAYHRPSDGAEVAVERSLAQLRLEGTFRRSLYHTCSLAWVVACGPILQYTTTYATVASAVSNARIYTVQ